MTDQVFTSFAIFATMRSGSNFLERLINQYDGVHCHGELFNKGFIGASDKHTYFGITRAERDQNPQSLMENIKLARPDTIPGFRIFGDHIDSVIQSTLLDKSCAKIILRRNPVESFVSLNIARKTDQWLIHDESDRKPARINFNLRKFRDYTDELNAFYQQVESVLAQTDQPCFEIGFDDLPNTDRINQLADFIGNCPPKQQLEQPIKRQNPGVLAEKIINYDEVRGPLGLPDLPTDIEIPETGTTLSRLHFCKNNALVYAPIPAIHDNQAMTWIQSYDSCNHGFGDQALATWRKTHNSPLIFSVTQHPVKRAYDVFMRKIFDTGPGSYLAIREALCNQFAFDLPAIDLMQKNERSVLTANGYDVENHRVAFKQFLAFVAANLSGETDIRQDGKWQAQSKILTQYKEIFPDILTLDETDLRLGLAYLQNRMGLSNASLPQHQDLDPFMFSLAETYDEKVESLCRATYEQDYTAFGYDALSSL